jgi:hypothetical protein
MSSNLGRFTIIVLSTLVTPTCVVAFRVLILMESAPSAHYQKQIFVVAPVVIVTSCVASLIILALTVVSRAALSFERTPPGHATSYLAVTGASSGLFGLVAATTQGVGLLGALIVSFVCMGSGLLWGLPVAASLRWLRR